MVASDQVAPTTAAFSYLRGPTLTSALRCAVAPYSTAAPA